jgi:hypothetical protein
MGGPITRATLSAAGPRDAKTRRSLFVRHVAFWEQADCGAYAIDLSRRADDRNHEHPGGGVRCDVGNLIRARHATAPDRYRESRAQRPPNSPLALGERVAVREIGSALEANITWLTATGALVATKVAPTNSRGAAILNACRNRGDRVARSVRRRESTRGSG